MRIPFQGAALALACAVSLPAVAQTAGFGFDPAVTLTGLTAGTYAAGDVNGDHRDDLVGLGSATPGSDGVRIYAQQADGTLGVAQDVAFARPLQGSPSSLVLVDLDHDGADEIVIGYSAANWGDPGNGLVILHRDGAGGYTRQTFAQTERNAQMAAADVNGDGNPDIITLAQREGLHVYLGDGAGGVVANYALPSATFASDTRELRIGDVTGDGLPDIVVDYVQSYPPYAPEIAVYPHDNFYSFLAPVLYQAADNASTEDGLAVADFTGDGLGDVVVRGSSSNLWLFAQNGTGGLVNPPATIPALAQDGVLTSADLDRDGYADLVKTYPGTTSHFAYYPGSPSGLLSAQTYSPLGPSSRYRPGNIVFGDFNGDGCGDVVVSSLYSQIVTSYQRVELVKGHGCAANADIAATISFDQGTGSVVAGIEHHSGMPVQDAHVLVNLQLASNLRFETPEGCVNQPIRLPPIRKPRPVLRAFDCVADALSLGERREFVFTLDGDPPLSADAEAYADPYDPKPDNNAAHFEP